MLDVEKLIAGIHEYIERATALLIKRIEAQDAEIAALRVSVGTDIAKAIEAIPKATPEPALMPEQLAPMIAEALAKAVADLPAPKDGKSLTLADLDPMKDAWALDFERYANGVLQRAIEQFPRPKDGADGFSLDDLQLSFDGERTMTLKFQRGTIEKSLDIVLPTLLDRGVFREGDKYLKNDGVTFGGSYWIVQKDSPEGKPGISNDFRLACKRGRDGKDMTK